MNRVGVVLVAVAMAFCGSRADAAPITYTYLQAANSVPGVVVEASITVDQTFANFPTLFFSCTFGPPCSYSENGSPVAIPDVLTCFPDCMFSPNFGNLLDFKLKLQNVGFEITLHQFRTIWVQKSWFIGPGFITFNDSGTSFSLTGGNTGSGAISFSSEAGGGCYQQRCFTEGVWVPTPEPGSMLLIGSGLAALAARFRRRRVA